MSGKREDKPIAAGKSSFDLVEVDKVFAALDLQPSTIFLDLACGRGSYSLEAGSRITGTGLVHAVDLWEEGVRMLQEHVAAHEKTNIKPMHCDAARIPLEDNSIDVCLMATVLHDFVVDKTADAVLQELFRVMKTGGLVAVVEFKKIEGPPGPPLHIRMAPEEVADKMAPRGFVRDAAKVMEVGPYNYLMKFRKSA